MISDLKHLKKIVFYGCVLDDESPGRLGWGYGVHSWKNLTPYFEKLSRQIRELEIIDSDVAIFSHTVRYDWQLLEQLKVIPNGKFDEAYISLVWMSQQNIHFDQSKGENRPFNSLSFLEISISKGFNEDAEGWINDGFAKNNKEFKYSIVKKRVL